MPVAAVAMPAAPVETERVAAPPAEQLAHGVSLTSVSSPRSRRNLQRRATAVDSEQPLPVTMRLWRPTLSRTRRISASSQAIWRYSEAS